MQSVDHQLNELIAPVVRGLGFEYVGSLFGQGETGVTLRVYIDAEGGVLVDHCAKVSEQLSALLEVEDPIASAYTLEVSSPGFDRPLFSPEDYARFVGQQVRIRTRVSVQGRRNFRGELTGADAEHAQVTRDDERFDIPFASIERARLVPDYSKV